MDTNPIIPFQREQAALERALSKVKTSAVERLEQRLSEERTKRAEVQLAFDALCAKERAKEPPGSMYTSQMIKLDGDIKAFDARIATLRHDLAKARAEMLPGLVDATQPCLRAVLVALEDALRVVEGARSVYNAYDGWASRNGFGSANVPRGTRLDQAAKLLARFLSDETR